MMTAIYFYSGAADKLRVVCRLCAKALNQDSRVIVYTSEADKLDRLDKLLWTFQSTSFLPHCYIDENEALVTATPIILSNRVVNEHAFDMLVNLHEHCPSAFDQFKRVIEVVSQSPEDESAARARYRFYKQAGYELHHHNLAETAS
ncbi:MAG TPA: DNA polymerase III subunit chi [Nitrosomonas sp.]|uniref:DNA polymerase III subunit chi n=1 Tax=Nitrosomonas sp. TaxID=42353 RepID=UPI0025F01427|nr:DNA polymerase III subunit chi [Nitrosomonas sp.]HNP25340.1 DNA polymerase III subunit chi [Nitrosomonas sp.]